MKKAVFILVLILSWSNFLFAQTWDILDKSMTELGANWEVTEGDFAGSVVIQQTDYINFAKMNTGISARWAWLRPTVAFTDLTEGLTYSIEVKAKVNPINKVEFPDEGAYLEANQIALRLQDKTSTPIYLRYGNAENGSISVTSDGTDSYKLNTSDWQVYRIVLRADMKYDVYIDGIEEPVFEGRQGGANGDQNGIYIGAESRHRCNIDIEYVKMGTGDFFSKPRILSVSLSQYEHIFGSGSIITATANMFAFNNGEKLVFSFVDENDNEIISSVESTVTNNLAAAAIVIPKDIAVGKYKVKVEANNPVSGIMVDSKTIPYEIVDSIVESNWDVLYRDFSKKNWSASPAWSLEKGKNVPSDIVTQQVGYVNVNKMLAYGSAYYGFLTSPEVNVLSNTAYTYEIKARTRSIDKSKFPDVAKPGNNELGGYEANQIGLLLNGKMMSIYLIHGDTTIGYIASPIADGTGVSPSYTARHALNTSKWHIYQLVFNADNTKYDIYVDDELIFQNVPLFNKSGSNVVKIGGESWQRCNMDIEYVKIATGDLLAENKPKLTTVELSSDSHIVNNARTIRLTANTVFVRDGEKLKVSFTDEKGIEVIESIELTINSGKGECNITIPATVPLGKYAITVASANGKIGEEVFHSKSLQYVVVGVSPFDAKMLPQVKPVGFVKDIADYKYKGKSNEFIFPSIIDTQKYTIDGKFKNGDTPIDRYYLYYAPHDNPGGIYLSTSSSLDGPWVEYDGTKGMSPGTVMDFDWAATRSDLIKNGAQKHISACQVVWNEVQNKYIMYFHGPNQVTHYATSDNLIDWTFGDSILKAHYFSPIGAEASYAKVFEHEIPGLGNKYVILLMGQENQIRKIYWAHSKDGINWTPVTKPLISPDLDYKKIPGTDTKPNYDGGGKGAYGNNVSGPFLMEKDGRYFVFVHGCTNHLLVVEVGECFDMEVHWGEYLRSTDAMFSVSGAKPKSTRIAAPDFIQDDNGKWYMFFEAGGRLNANIGYAKEEGVNEVVLPESTEISIFPSMVKKGEDVTIYAENTDVLFVEVFDLAGNRLIYSKICGSSCAVQAPLISGLYFVKVSTNNNQTRVMKMIVK